MDNITQYSINRFWLISLSTPIFWAVLLAVMTPSIEQTFAIDNFSSSWLRYLLMFLPCMYLPYKLPIWLKHTSQHTIIIINAVCVMGLLCLLIIGFAKIIK